MLADSKLNGELLAVGCAMSAILDGADARHWRVSAANDRTETVAVFRRTPAGKWKKPHSLTTNYIDGHDVGIAHDSADLRRMFTNPDNYTQAAHTPLPMPPAPSPSDHVPRSIREARETLSGSTSADVQLGRDSAGWVLGVDIDNDKGAGQYG